jgi:FKBP-type peptidyl-prolyl cis-trans isomerase
MPSQKRTRPDGKVPRGLNVEDLKVGEGPKARRGNIVDVRYAIRLNRGELLAEGVQRGLILGTRRTFAGFERGIEGMQVGGLRRLRVPPHLAYRDGRLLICELELISINHYR